MNLRQGRGKHRTLEQLTPPPLTPPTDEHALGSATGHMRGDSFLPRAPSRLPACQDPSSTPCPATKHCTQQPNPASRTTAPQRAGAAQCTCRCGRCGRSRHRSHRSTTALPPAPPAAPAARPAPRFRDRGGADWLSWGAEAWQHNATTACNGRRCAASSKGSCQSIFRGSGIAKHAQHRTGAKIPILERQLCTRLAAHNPLTPPRNHSYPNFPHHLRRQEGHLVHRPLQEAVLEGEWPLLLLLLVHAVKRHKAVGARLVIHLLHSDSRNTMRGEINNTILFSFGAITQLAPALWSTSCKSHSRKE